MRICFFGDSFMNGTGDPEGMGWVGRACAAARHAGHDLTCYNLGIRRDTSADILARWEGEARRRLPPEHPGALVFSFGANDCTPGADGGTRISLPASLANAGTLLIAARARLPTLMVGPCPIVDDPETDARIAALSTALRTLCQQLEVPFIEVHAPLAASPAWRESALEGDGCHPDGRGYAVLAGLVLAAEPWRAMFMRG